MRSIEINTAGVCFVIVFLKKKEHHAPSKSAENRSRVPRIAHVAGPRRSGFSILLQAGDLDATPEGIWLEQGSLHYTPEHCLVNGGFNLYFGGKSHVSNGQNVSFKEP